MSMDTQTREDRLYRMRHSAAHIMAEAVLEMFPEAKFAIGPPIDNGFYYDFELSRALTPEDLRRDREADAGAHGERRAVRAQRDDEGRRRSRSSPASRSRSS